MSEPTTPKPTEPPVTQTVEQPKASPKLTERPAIDLTTLVFHPLAEMFPLIEGEELMELASDIKKQGLLEPIMMFEDKVLDGRNRVRALKALGDTHLPRNLFRELTCGQDPKAYVISENVRRRHLTAEQKREVIASLLKDDPTKSNRAIAGVAKVDHQTVGAVREGLVSGGEIPHPDQRVGKDGKKQKGSKRTNKKPKEAAPHVAYKAKQEELIDLLRDTHTSYAQAEEWVDNTKQRLDETLSGIGEELDGQDAA